MMPPPFSEEGAAEKHMPQLQRNMRVTNAKLSVLSIITGGGKWVEISIAADPLYPHLLLTTEKKFWRLNTEEARGSPLSTLEAARRDAWVRFAKPHSLVELF